MRQQWTQKIQDEIPFRKVGMKNIFISTEKLELIQKKLLLRSFIRDKNFHY